MAIKLTNEEIQILDKADNDIAMRGYTEEKCPRCNGNIIVEEAGKSYTVKCTTENCISLDFRGV